MCLYTCTHICAPSDYVRLSHVNDHPVGSQGPYLENMLGLLRFVHKHKVHILVGIGILLLYPKPFLRPPEPLLFKLFRPCI